ncbi:TauD/TfdA family dioxygenase [Mesobaculum littorinae]|uniref:TauD/TfdA family dioxygenase n=1 Tax=Mesobaculum littorinae TaxID=2486419 RepID=A0A438AEA7_9RHOB|nr:TauD/TfdA family dioxygenase [Mesobaculum littorinae]RVV97019.1 TauD/TfdA family dioxygenase [Mesobaculum littorinae]
MFTTRPLDGPFGVAITGGLDVRAPLSPEAVEEIDRLMDEHALVLIRDQPMTTEEQLAFTRQFGPLDIGFKKVVMKQARNAEAEVGDISNLGRDGKPAARTDKRILNNIANQLWHSDSSFQKPAAKYSMLHSVRTPSWGGETEFADLRAAYDALDPRIRDLVNDRMAEHFALHSRFLLGDDSYDADQIAAIDPAMWPVVRTNPRTGRRHLFIGVHARRIEGMTVPEGRMILLDLLEHATAPRFVYRHTWKEGDTLIWDNRQTLHRGRHFDLDEPRELRRTTTLDDRAPELALAG